MRSLSFLLFLLLFSPFAKAQLDLSFFELPDRSRFNQMALLKPDSGWSYTFLAAGHLYGAHENERSIYPAASLLANMDMINGQAPSAFIALGDIVRSAKDQAAIQGWQTVGKLFRTPIFNAPGNHDLDDREAYRKAYGNTQSSFFIRDDLFLIIDTEFLREGKEDKVRSFIEEQITKVKSRVQSVRHLFVFSHRLLAPVCSDDLKALDGLANETFSDKVDTEKACEVYRSLADIPHQGEHWHFSGDVGTHWSVPGVYGFDSENNCHVLAAGLGDTDRDMIARINVAFNGKITAELIPLAPGKNTLSAKDVTPEYWEKQGQEVEGGSDEGLWSKISSLPSNKGFWIGMGLMLLLSALFNVIRKRFRSKS